MTDADVIGELCKNDSIFRSGEVTPEGSHELDTLNSVISTLKLYLDVTLAKQGPQDLPTSVLLLVMTTAAYLLLFCILVVSLGPPPMNWLGQLFASTMFSLLWIRILLTLASRPERFLQTATGSMAISLLTLPISVPLQLQLLRMVELARKSNATSVPLDGSSYVVLLAFPIMLWIIYAQAQIIRAALEVRLFQALLLVIAEAVLESMLLGSLFAPPAPTG